MTTRIAAALSDSIREHAKRRGIALLPFVTAGWPVMDSWTAMLTALSRHAAAIEVGIPFSDPMADGMTIQRSSREALALGVTARWVFDELLRVRGSTSAPIVIMSYLNPLMSLGPELPGLCRSAGVEAVIIADLPFDESEPWKSSLAASGVGLVHMVTPMTPQPRLGRVASNSEGFLYAVTRTGVTGDGGTQQSDLNAYLARCRAVTRVPVCAGFGIRDAADVRRLVGHCDGAIVGSALVDAIGRGENAAEFVRGLLP